MKNFEVLSAVSGMALSCVWLYNIDAKFTFITLVMWAVILGVIRVYHHNDGLGILLGIVSFLTYCCLVGFLYPGDWLPVILLGAIIALAGGVVIWFGGFLGALLFVIVEWLLKKVFPALKAQT